MIQHLTTATKVAGLTYRLLSTIALIGFLTAGVYKSIKKR